MSVGDSTVAAMAQLLWDYRPFPGRGEGRCPTES